MLPTSTNPTASSWSTQRPKHAWPSCETFRFVGFQESAEYDAFAAWSTLVFADMASFQVSERWLQALGVLTVGDIYTHRGKLYLVVSVVGSRVSLHIRRYAHSEAKSDWTSSVALTSALARPRSVTALEEDGKALAASRRFILRRSLMLSSAW